MLLSPVLIVLWSGWVTALTTWLAHAPVVREPFRRSAGSTSIQSGISCEEIRSVVDAAPQSNASARNELPGDHIAEDLVGALTDDHEGGVAEVTFDVKFGGVAVAAVNADRVKSDLHRHFGRE